MGCHILSFLIKNLKKYLNNYNSFTVFLKQATAMTCATSYLIWNKKEDPDPGRNLTELIGNPSLQMMANIHQDRGEGVYIPAFPLGFSLERAVTFARDFFETLFIEMAAKYLEKLCSSHYQSHFSFLVNPVVFSGLFIL